MSVAQPEARLAPLRLLPVPASEPPYDDELPPAARLRLVPPPSPAPPVPVGPGRDGLRLLPPPPVSPGPAVRAVPAAPDEEQPELTPLASLPPARPFAHALVQRLLEVLAGLRPVGQLQADTTLELYDRLTAAVVARRRTTGPRPTARDVRSVHVQARADGVAEVCATVHRAGRTTALAFRLEGRSGTWRCTDLVGL